MKMFFEIYYRYFLKFFFFFLLNIYIYIYKFWYSKKTHTPNPLTPYSGFSDLFERRTKRYEVTWSESTTLEGSGPRPKNIHLLQHWVLHMFAFMTQSSAFFCICCCICCGIFCICCGISLHLLWHFFAFVVAFLCICCGIYLHLLHLFAFVVAFLCICCGICFTSFYNVLHICLHLYWHKQ